MLRQTGFVLVLVACAGCESSFKPPRPDSYSVKTVQVTSGNSATSDFVRMTISFSAKGASVTNDFFKQVGAEPYLGRLFLPADDQSIVVLSNECWREYFGARPDVIGQKIDVDGRPSVIVGVGPQGFSLPTDTYLWTPKP